MQKKKIRRSNLEFQIDDNPPQWIIVGLPALFLGTQGSSYAPVFLPVVFLVDIQH